MSECVDFVAAGRWGEPQSSSRHRTDDGLFEQRYMVMAASVGSVD